MRFAVEDTEKEEQENVRIEYKCIRKGAVRQDPMKTTSDMSLYCVCICCYICMNHRQKLLRMAA